MAAYEMNNKDVHGNLSVRMGQRIQDGRKAKGMKQIVLAEIIGTSNSNLSKIEHGKSSASPDLVVAIAKALNTSPNKLMEFHDETDIFEDCDEKEKELFIRLVDFLKKEYRRFTSR